MTSCSQNTNGACPTAGDALEVLLWFGTSMLRAGSTAFRTREWMEVVALKLGFEAISVGLTIESITASVRRDGEWSTLVREIGPLGVNAWRIGELEHLAKTLGPAPAPQYIASRLAEIDTAAPRYSNLETAAAVGVACGGFAFLNGGAVLEVIAAAAGGGLGQWLRLRLIRLRLNQYGVAALSAVAASASYVAIAALAAHLGLGIADQPGGFISSVLFLIPGFPLVAALMDLLQFQTAAAVTRLAYGTMILLAAAFGLSIVIAFAGLNLTPQPPHELAYPVKLLLRAAASFGGACGFALLYNSSARTLLAVGFIAMGANELRLALYDVGMKLAPATFFGAIAVGLAASLFDRRPHVPRIAITVPGVIVMVPGVYAFQMIVLFNRGQMLDALQASASCGFVMGAMAMGLAAARFISQR